MAPSPGPAFGVASGQAGLSRGGERRTGFLLAREGHLLDCCLRGNDTQGRTLDGQGRGELLHSAKMLAELLLIGGLQGEAVHGKFTDSAEQADPEDGFSGVLGHMEAILLFLPVETAPPRFQSRLAHGFPFFIVE